MLDTLHNLSINFWTLNCGFSKITANGWRNSRGNRFLVSVCIGSSYPELTVSWRNEKHLLYNFMNFFFFHRMIQMWMQKMRYMQQQRPVSFQRGQQLMMFNHWCWQRKEWLSVVSKKSIFWVQLSPYLLAIMSSMQTIRKVMVVIARMCIYFLSTFCCKGADMHCR